MSWRDRIKQGSDEKPSSSWRDRVKKIEKQEDPESSDDTLETISDSWQSFKEGLPGAGLVEKGASATAAGIDQVVDLFSERPDKSFSEHYDKHQDSGKQEIADREKRTPIGTMVGNVGGAFVAPNPASIAGRVGLNVFDQATRADSMDELKNRASTAALVSTAMEAIPVAGKYLKKSFAKPANAVAQPVSEVAEEAMESGLRRVAGDSVQVPMPTPRGMPEPILKEVPAIPTPEEKSNAVSNWLRKRADDFSAKGLGAERGTIKSMGIDKVRAAGRHALKNDILAGDTEAMISRNNATKRKGGDLMDQVYGEIDSAGASTFNPFEAATKVDAKIGDFWRSPLNRGETKQFDNTMEAIFMHGTDNIPLKQAQLLKEELGSVANWKNKLNITDKEQMARDAYGVVSDEIDRATELGAKTIGSDGLAKTLKEGRKLYSDSKSAEALLENKLAREQGNKMFGLTDSIVGVGSLGYGATTDDWTTAAGIMGGKKILGKYGNKVAAKTLDKSADFMDRISNKIPLMPAKFQQTLQSAAQRGGNSLAVTHFLLGNQNPEYQSYFLDEDDEQ